MGDKPETSFDPPRPPEQSVVETVAVVAGGVAAIGALVMADVATGGLLGALGGIPGGGDSTRPIDVEALERAIPGLAQTAPPQFTADQRVVCTGCAAAVRFDSMSLNEDGYFCARCAGRP